MSTPNAITLLTGPAASGKSAAAIEIVREQRRGKALVVVPSGLQKRWLREQAGRLYRVTFRQFYGLADQVLRITGEPPKPLDESLRLVVVRTLMRDLIAEGRLPHMRRVGAKQGFVAQVVGLLTALQENMAEPAALAAAQVGPYDQELAVIYEAYLRWQQQHGLADISRRLLLACDALNSTPGLFASYDLLVIDGFDQFTPVQLSLIQALTQQIPKTVITLTHEANERPALRRFSRTYTQLQELLYPIEQTLTASERDRDVALHVLGSQLFALDETPSRDAHDALWLIEAADREREVRAALRRVKRLIDEGTPPEQIGILLRDSGAYAALLREVANEYGLPLTLADGMPLIEVPAVAALLQTLHLPLDDYPRRGVIDAWRARGAALADETMPLELADPALDWSWAASTFDRAARSAGLAGGLERLRAALATLADADVPDDPDDEGRRPLVARDDARTILVLLNAFAAWLTPPDEASVADFAAWVRSRSLGLRPLVSPVIAGDEEAYADAQSPSANRQSPVWLRFDRVLLDLERAAALLGAGSTSYAAFIAELSAAVGAARYGREEPRSGAVAALPVLAARGSSFAHGVLLGLSEGEFPSALPDPPFYSRRERALLRERGVPISSPDPADEQSLFYEALARARNSLTLCRTYLDESGNPLPPSPYLRAVRDVLSVPEKQIMRVVAGSVPSFDQAVSPDEMLVALVEHQRKTGVVRLPAFELPEQDALWQHIQQAIAVERGRENNAPYGVYEGVVADQELIKTLHERFGPEHRWSVTQLNDYITCPFIFFSRHVLKLDLQEEPEAALRGSGARALRGRLDHAVLAETVRRWQEAHLSPRSDQALLMAEFNVAAASVLAAAPERFGFAPDRFWAWDSDNLRRRLSRALRRTLSEGEDWSHFTPAAVEQSFGYGNIPPLRLDTSAGQVQVMGRIDRVDQREDGALAVIDYKSGSQPKALRETLEGRDVQLPIYVHAVEQVLPIGQGQRVERAAFVQTGSGKRSTPLTGAERQQASEVLYQRVAEVVDNVRDGLFTVRPRDACPDHCLFSAICRVNLRKQSGS